MKMNLITSELFESLLEIEASKSSFIDLHNKYNVDFLSYEDSRLKIISKPE